MKFCTNCGHEMFDDAVICTNCGRPVAGFSYGNAQANVQPTPKPNAPAKENKSVLTFNFVSSIMIAITMFFLLLALASPHISVNVHSARGSYLDHSHYAHASYYVSFGLVLVAMITSVCAFGFGLTSFIVSLVKRQKLQILFSSILHLIIGALLVIASITILGL